MAVPAEKAMDIRRGGVRSGSRNAYRGNGSFRGEASGGLHRKRRTALCIPSRWRFLGVTAAVVVALLCVLIGLIIGGAFLKKRRAAQITGAAGLLIMSLAMVGSSAFMALGSPVRERYSVSYSDEERGS